MIIDTAYFTGDCYLPNRGDTVVSSSYTQAINQREPEYLDLVLGTPLYLAFKAGILVDPMEPRWFDLLNGANYTYQGVNHRWGGFQNPERRSPIANYTFYWLLRGVSSISTGTGEVLPSVENGTRGASSVKQCRAWNAMVKMNVDLFMFLDANAPTYPEFNKEYYGNRYLHCRKRSTEIGSLFTTINALSI